MVRGVAPPRIILLPVRGGAFVRRGDDMAGKRGRHPGIDRAAAYRACAADGLTLTETAARLEVSIAAVCLWSQKNGVMFRDGRTSSRDAAYRACAAEGLNMAEAARRLGVPPVSIARWNTKHGAFPSDEFRSKRLASYRACAAEGLSLTEAARRLGVSFSAVRGWSQRNGVRFRDGRKRVGRDGEVAE